jgi:hypothetical protein
MAQAMAVVGIGATIAGGITQAAGARAAGQATLAQNNYQAGIAEINSKIAKQNADYARTTGEIQATQYGIKAAQRSGMIRAGQGASGIDVNSGTAVDVRASQAKTTAMDLAQIRRNAAKTAYDFDTQSVGFDNQAALYKMAGANAVTAANYQATASILGTVSSVSSKWMQGSQVGMLGGSGGGGVDYGSGGSAAP